MAILRLAAALPALLLTAFLAGCSTPADEGGDGSASVYVKDAPTDEFDEIHVVFTEVRVHAAGGEDDEDGEDEDLVDDEDDEDQDKGDVDVDVDAEGNGTDGNVTVDGNATEDDDDGAEAGWMTLFESSDGVDVDLLNASGDQAAFLGEADLEAGKYTQIRVVVKEAYGMQNGTRVDFDVSSGTLKLVQPFTVESGMESRIVLDFDLDQALHQTGNGQWRMTPVIGTTTVDVVEDAGSGEDAAQEGEVVAVEAE